MAEEDRSLFQSVVGATTLICAGAGSPPEYSFGKASAAEMGNEFGLRCPG